MNNKISRVLGFTLKNAIENNFFEFTFDDNNITIIEIPGIEHRRYFFDALSICLMNYDFSERELFLRDYMYRIEKLHHNQTEIHFLTANGSTMKRIYRPTMIGLSDERIFLDKREASRLFTQYLVREENSNLWKSSLIWDTKQVRAQNELCFLCNKNDNKPSPLAFLEPDKLDKTFIYEILTYPGQSILVSEDASTILSLIKSGVVKNEK